MRLTRLLQMTMVAATLPLSPPLAGQAYTSPDPVIRRIFAEGMDSSQVYRLGQVLLDSIGPRLTGTPNLASGNDWLVRTYSAWGVPARNERYGTWKGWRRGAGHVDLVAPRVRTLEGGLNAWSPGTDGRDVSGPVILLPLVADSGAFVAWLPQVKGKFVAITFPEPTCRPDDEWRARAAPSSFERMSADRDGARADWNRRVQATGYGLSTRGPGTLAQRLGQAGAAGVVSSVWENNGWGTRRVFGDLRQVAPAIDLSCEDYGLVFRLAQHRQGPVLRLRADAESLGDTPVFNTIAEIRGSEKPNEYVILSAHFDSWDGGTGTTDNGTGTLIMLEAMRILKKLYPNPRRTILAAHWAGEEQGLNGSHAYVEDHPDVVRGLQALFNHDDGTGRIVNVNASGFTEAGASLARWLSKVPSDLTAGIRLEIPGMPSGGGTDASSFVCAGAPGFGLGSSDWDYGPYTWHSNRDTFDKIVWDDLKNNATLVAILAYLAAGDPITTPRDRRSLDRGPRQPDTARSGRAGARGTPITEWPSCTKALRSTTGYAR